MKCGEWGVDQRGVDEILDVIQNIFKILLYLLLVF